MQSGFLLNVIITQSSAVLELFSGENQALLIRWNSLFILNLALDIVDRVARLDLERDGLSGQSLDEDLHSAS